MTRFAEGELALPIRSILWAPSNSAHYNHLHVEGPYINGTLANCSSKWTPAVKEIWDALSKEFPGWSNMGVYNCRNVAGTNTPSQHAFSNAIDIGPYYGVAEQQKFYDFLTRKEDDEVTEQEIINAVKKAMGIYTRTDHTGDVYDHSRVVAESVWQIGFGRGDTTRYPGQVLASIEKYAKLAAKEAAIDTVDISDADIANLANQIKEDLGDAVAKAIGEKLVS